MSESTNFKSPLSGMDRYGKQRLELAVLLRDEVLNQLDVPWTLENGTLLGAWRNGMFIPHDDDFDFALFFESDPMEMPQDILNKIKKLLPAPYEVRLVTSYCNKIEVFDPSYGSYILPGPLRNGATYHHVTADLQFYQRDGDVYKSHYFIKPFTPTVKHKDVFPTGKITLEGEIFKAPGNVEPFLKCLYGSLSPKARYKLKTGLYEDPKEVNGSI